MLDKKTDAVLQLLASKTDSSYKVLDKNQLLAELPRKLGVDGQAFSSIVAFLKENEYVDVKYQDKDEICICTTIKTESYMVGEKDIQQKAKITNGQLSFLLLAMFFASFFGALVATLVGKLF